MIMEVNADIVIAGAGIAGLATALALHRLGIKCLVLESSDTLRAAGFAFTTWTNAWKALDALGVGDMLRQQHVRLTGIVASSTVSGELNSYIPFTTRGKHGDHEVRCMKRKVLLEALAKELPNGTIRYSSKVVSIQESGGFSRMVHLADGSILRTKVLIGCDGVNSIVAKSLGFKKPSLAGRLAIRGCVYFKGGHGLDNKFQMFMANRVKYGIIPCDDTAVFFSPGLHPTKKKILEEADQVKMKQFVLSKLGNVPDKITSVIKETEVKEFTCYPLRFRPPWEILCGNISKDNVCVTGDACHPMTPDLGQGGCSALEDGIILAKCLADALSKNQNCELSENCEKDEFERIKIGLGNYAKKRRWRAVDLISTGYILGFIDESNWIGMRFLRERVISAFLSGILLRKADVDPGQLVLKRYEFIFHDHFSEKTFILLEQVSLFVG